MPAWERHQAAEKIMDNSGVPISYKPSDRAFYSIRNDAVTMPERVQFKTPDQFYGTALHELGHATGHPTRLNRPDLGTPFGSASYAREELRAEIASLMIADRLGIGHDPGQHAAYVKFWIQALKDEPREIFRAAADAEKITGYLIALRAEQKVGQAAGRNDSQAGDQARNYWQRAAESGAEIRRTEMADRPEQERQTRGATVGR